MKNFDDFISFINEENNKKLLDYKFDTKFSFTEQDIQEYTKTILETNFNITVNLLKLYHNWLQSDKKD